MWGDAQKFGADRAKANLDETGWVTIGGRSRPVDIWRYQEGEFEGMARGMMGIQENVESLPRGGWKVHRLERGRRVGRWKGG